MVSLASLLWNIPWLCRKIIRLVRIIWLLYDHQLESLVIISFLSSFCPLIMHSWSQSSESNLSWRQKSCKLSLTPSATQRKKIWLTNWYVTKKKTRDWMVAVLNPQISVRPHAKEQIVLGPITRKNLIPKVWLGVLLWWSPKEKGKTEFLKV